MNCKNCNEELTGTYCSHCGQKQLSDRFTVKRILTELISMITNIEKGFWFTTKMLFSNPAKMINDYIGGITVRYYNPFRYLIIWVAIGVFINLNLGMFDLQQEAIREFSQVQQQPQSTDLSERISQKMRELLNIFPLLFVPFLALFSFLVYRSKGWNYAEHLITNAYLYAQLSLLGIIPILFFYFNQEMILFAFPIAIMIAWIYYSYAFRDIMKTSTFSAVWKSFFIVFGGYMSSMIFIGLLGIIVAFIYLLFNPIT